jgi:hypothetical protein
MNNLSESRLSISRDKALELLKAGKSLYNKETDRNLKKAGFETFCNGLKGIIEYAKCNIFLLFLNFR